MLFNWTLTLAYFFAGGLLSLLKFYMIQAVLEVSIVKELERIIGHNFKNEKLLKIAITHSSFANELGKSESYERLEFLGDSILGFITSEYLFSRFQNLPEGELTRMRSCLVCEKTLKNFSANLGIGNFLRLSHGEQRSGGRNRSSILADVFEALVAALYLDSGIENTKNFVLRFIVPETDNLKNSCFRDYKTEIQELVQVNPENSINYELVSATGPDHDKVFVVSLMFNGKKLGVGRGKNKKEAEQHAAEAALKVFEASRKNTKKLPSQLHVK
jgi:ribonuclease-3